MNKLLRVIYHILKSFLSFRWLAYFIGFILPINKRRILISIDNGEKYGDNCKYIYEELLKKTNTKIDYCFVVSKKHKLSIPGKHKEVLFNSFKCITYHLTSLVWIDNSRKCILHKKNKTLYIQTWHGGGLYKRVEASIENELPDEYVKIAKRDSKFIDVFVSESNEKTKSFYRDFWYNNYVLQIGNPRNDILIKALKDFNVSNIIRKKVYDFYNLPKDSKIVLYAPTFRKDGDISCYIDDYDLLIKSCQKRFGGEFVVLLRLHGNVIDKCSNISFSKRVINASFYDDTQELLIASDVLITDYSSINYDFSFLKRPSFRYATDVNKYMLDRGFYYNIEDYPYPLAHNMVELCMLIENFDYLDFMNKDEIFKKRMGVIETDNASSICSNLILDYILLQNKKDIAQKYNLIFKK